MSEKQQIVIGISGASCSGKSWLAHQICNLSPSNICIFELDKYYKDIKYVENLVFQHDNPNAIDYDRAFGDIKKLMNGKDICIPVYDYESHKIVGWNTCSSAPVLIIEGLFAFFEKRFRELMDFKVWVEADENVRFKRRIRRDTTERGDNPVDAKYRYEHDVVPAYIEFISNCRKYADGVYINNVV